MNPKPLPSLNHLTVPVAMLIAPVMTIEREHMPTQCRDTHEITEQRFDRVLPGRPNAAGTG